MFRPSTPDTVHCARVPDPDYPPANQSSLLSRGRPYNQPSGSSSSTRALQPMIAPLGSSKQQTRRFPNRDRLRPRHQSGFETSFPSSFRNHVICAAAKTAKLIGIKGSSRIIYNISGLSPSSNLDAPRPIGPGLIVSLRGRLVASLKCIRSTPHSATYPSEHGVGGWANKKIRQFSSSINQVEYCPQRSHLLRGRHRKVFLRRQNFPGNYSLVIILIAFDGAA